MSSYELVRGLRDVGEKDDGTFSISASRTVGVPVERLYDAFADERLSERTARRPRSARFDWDDGNSRVNVSFASKSEAKSTVAVEHVRLRDAEQAEEMKGWWRARLTALKGELEGGDDA